MFVDRFDEVMDVAARGVRVELTLPWYFEVYRFYGEEISVDPTQIEPQHLAPGDAMTFNQVLRACTPEVVDPEDEITIRVTWERPLTHEQRSAAVTKRISELLAAPAPALVKGKAIVAYAEALKLGTSEALHAARDTVIAADPTESDPELDEIAGLLELHPAY